MSDNDPFRRAYFSLRKAIAEHDRHRSIAQSILTGIQSELKVQFPEVEQLRWAEALFITIAGYRVYFRFTYSLKCGFVDYGMWSSTRRGHPAFSRVGEWQLKPEWNSSGTQGDWLHPLSKQSLVAITEVMDWFDTWSSDLPHKRQATHVRRLCPEKWYLSSAKATEA
jgi:hypothetical protein